MTSWVAGCALTLPMDPDKRYPALDASTQRIERSSSAAPRIVLAGTVLVAADDAHDQTQPQRSPVLKSKMLDGVRDGLASSAPVISTDIQEDISGALLCGAGTTAIKDEQADRNCVMPDHWPRSSINERLRAAGATHVLLVVGKVTRTTGEKETTWGVAAGYGGAAPAFTTETEVVHRFTVHGRVYDIDSGLLMSDVAVSDQDTGSYGVMGMIMPYTISVDEAAFFATMGSRVGEELGKRFMRGLTPH